jgi:hypothetical protein
MAEIEANRVSSEYREKRKVEGLISLGPGRRVKHIHLSSLRRLNLNGVLLRIQGFEKSKIEVFTPLESPSIYAGDGRNRKHQLSIEGGVKALPCTILG